MTKKELISVKEMVGYCKFDQNGVDLYICIHASKQALKEMNMEKSKNSAIFKKMELAEQKIDLYFNCMNQELGKRKRYFGEAKSNLKWVLDRIIES